MNKFEQYGLSLSEKHRKVIEEYLSRIQKFISKHNLDHELYIDIEEMVFEKVSSEKKITDIKIVQILQEVWEPEEIFSDSIAKEGKNEKIPLYEKLEKSEWTRNNQDAVVLWISHTLSRKMSLPVWFIRIAFIILLMPFWETFFLYGILGILLPVEWRNYEWKTHLQYIGTQIFFCLNDGVRNSVKSCIKWIRYIVKNIWLWVQFLWWFLRRNLWWILRVIFFGVVWIIWIFILASLLFIWSIYFTNFSISSIDFTSVLPQYFIHGIIAGVIAFIIFIPQCFMYGFTKKSLPWTLLFSAWVLLIFSLFSLVSSGLTLGEKYQTKHTFSQDTWVIAGDESYALDINNILDRGAIFQTQWWLDVEIIKSSDRTIGATLETIIYGDNSIFESFKEGVGKIEFTSDSSSSLRLHFENDTKFTKKTLFSPHRSTLILSIPEWVEIKITPKWGYYLDNTVNSEWMKYSEITSTSCYGREIYFSSSEEKFVCKIAPEEESDMQKEYIISEAARQLDDISPLQHSNSYNGKYYNRYSDKHVSWYIEEIFADLNRNNHLIIEFWDSNMLLTASVQFEEVNNDLIFSHFVIENIELKGYLDKKDYIDTTSIQKFLEEGKSEEE